MKLKLFSLGMFFVLSSTNVFADTINGFDGFNWGVKKNDIIQVRGEESFLWGETVVWKAKEGEKVSNFDIRLIGYDFKKGCNPVQDSISEPCLLWGGTYVLETTSSVDIGTLTDLLKRKYGEYRSTSETSKKTSAETNELLANVNVATHVWEQADKSSIELFYKSYDRDHPENVKKGIFIIGVRYYSSDYTKEIESEKTKALAREKNKEKSF